LYPVSDYSGNLRFTAKKPQYRDDIILIFQDKILVNPIG
jgi:hypothetical protein